MQIAIHVVQSRHAGEQKKHWDKTNKENYCLKLVITKGYEERATTIKVTCDQAIFFFGGGGGGKRRVFFFPRQKKKKRKKKPDRRPKKKKKTIA